METAATLAPVTKTEQMLRALPAPSTPVAIAVYEFVDYTGQNKPGETPQYSRAVTQGGLAILKKALLDAGDHHWFRVVERGGINNLLNERKIIRSMRAGYTTADGRRLPPLGPLTYAGVILEGGITSYESNIATGGLGARYLGIGGSTTYSRDMVTVYLRAVSVTTGEVLLSVSTSKTVYSVGLSGGLFKFVAYDKIAESETGVTYNEPPQLAVRQAIEMAVYSLILEGCKGKLWSMADPSEHLVVYNGYQQDYKGSALEPNDRTTTPKVMLASSSARVMRVPDRDPSSSAGSSAVQNMPIAKSPAAPTVNAASNPRIIEREAQPQVRVSMGRPAAWYIQLVPTDRAQRAQLSRSLSSSGFSARQQCTESSSSSDACSLLVGPYATRQLAARMMGAFSVFGEAPTELVYQR